MTDMQTQIATLQEKVATKQASFTDVLALIDANYDFTPTAFDNADVHNPAGTNNGSCKVFSFAKLHGFTAEETLKLFAEHYDDVLNSPQGDTHQNIRAFQKNGWDKLAINIALNKKT